MNKEEVKKLSDEELKPYYSEYIRRWKVKNKGKVKEYNLRYSLKKDVNKKGIPLQSKGIPLNKEDKLREYLKKSNTKCKDLREYLKNNEDKTSKNGDLDIF